MKYLAAAAGLIIESDIPLPGLCTARGPASVALSRGRVDVDTRSVEWIQQWIGDDRRPWLACGRVDEGYLLRFTALADVLVDLRAKRMLWSPAPEPAPRKERSDGDLRGAGRIIRSEGGGADVESIARLIAGQVVPRVLSLDGPPVLHASAVAIDGGAIVLAGESGAGKSTLAAALCAAGGALLADDFVVLQAGGDRFSCPPTAASVNLAPASIEMLGYASRAPRMMPDLAAEAPPVHAVYLLERNAPHDVVVERVRQQDAFIRLFRLSYRMDSSAPSVVRAEFARLAAFVAAVPVHTLRAPCGAHPLDRSVAAILRSSRLVVGE